MPVSSEIASSLALAMVAASAAPLLLLDGDLNVLAASASFSRAFQISPKSVANQPLSALGDGEWARPQLQSLLKLTASGQDPVEAYEMDLNRTGRETRQLVLNAKKLDYADVGNTRILLAVLDVTDARLAEKLKDDLVREKQILLQELQHRVANSLQIIAGVLMQSARKVQSEETRGHLYEAHNRVMSVAAIQNHLAPSRIGDVELRNYFKSLCESIGASMIHDHEQISLTATSDDSKISADVSVSLGLIVTELVINALKHAFPAQRKGKIDVDYHSQNKAWTLSVIDNGIGMPDTMDENKVGLGTTIVESIAKQLGAHVEYTNANPGTEVSVVHT